MGIFGKSSGNSLNADNTFGKGYTTVTTERGIDIFTSEDIDDKYMDAITEMLKIKDTFSMEEHTKFLGELIKTFCEDRFAMAFADKELNDDEKALFYELRDKIYSYIDGEVDKIQNKSYPINKSLLIPLAYFVSMSGYNENAYKESDCEHHCCGCCADDNDDSIKRKSNLVFEECNITIPESTLRNLNANFYKCTVNVPDNYSMPNPFMTFDQTSDWNRESEDAPLNFENDARDDMNEYDDDEYEENDFNN